MRVVFAAHPHGCISYTGDISHWKGSEKGTAQHGAGMQCHRIPVRVSLVNTDPVLLARPHSIPLLCHFHRSTADSQRRFQAARKWPCLQHDGACVSADVEAASAFYYSVRAADRSGLSILFEAIAPHPAAAVYRSSLKLSRHTLPQLLIGSAVSLLACGISLLTYGLG